MTFIFQQFVLPNNLPGVVYVSQGFLQIRRIFLSKFQDQLLAPAEESLKPKVCYFSKFHACFASTNSWWSINDPHYHFNLARVYPQLINYRLYLFLGNLQVCSVTTNIRPDRATPKFTVDVFCGCSLWLKCRLQSHPLVGISCDILQ